MTPVAAYNNPNRPGAHPPRKTAPNRPSFLIHNPELETGLTCTKQIPDLVSNRQFFAFLKLPNNCAGGPGSKPLTFGVPHARFVSVGLFSEPSRRWQQAKSTGKLPKTPRKRHSLIGNEMHSPANATTLKCAISIFLIGNEFRFARRGDWGSECVKTVSEWNVGGKFRSETHRPKKRRAVTFAARQSLAIKPLTVRHGDECRGS